MEQEITVTRRRLVEILNGLIEYMKHASDFDLCMMLAKNTRVIRPEVMDALGADKTSLDYAEFLGQKKALLDALSTKDEKGKPIMVDNDYILDDAKLDHFNMKLHRLENRFAKAIESEKERAEKVNARMNEQITIKVIKIPARLFKVNFVGAGLVLDKMMELIDDG